MRSFFKLNYISFCTIFYKEMKRVFRIWPQTFLPSIIIALLYFIIFGKIIGSQINNIKNYSYIQYIIPGLIMMSIINNSYINVSFSFFSAKFQKYIEEILISPTDNSIIILGFISAGITRGISIGFIIFVISFFFVKINIYSIPLTIFFSILISVLFSLAGFLNGMFANKFDDVNIVPTFIITPMIYLSGVFFPITFLSCFYQKLIYINPMFYMINMFRYSILHLSDVDVNISLFIIIIIIIMLYYCCIFFLKNVYKLKF